MNFNYLLIRLTFMLLVFSFQLSKAQCPLASYVGIIAPTSGTVFTTYPNYGPGYYFAFPMLNGGSYAVSTCGASIDTQISGWDPSASSVIFFNDNNGALCTGSQASIDNYVPNFTNYAYVQVSEYNCSLGGSSSINLFIRQNNNLAFTSSSASMCSGQTRNLSATPANVGSTPGGYGNPGTFSGTGVSGTVFTAPVVATPTNYTITYTFGYVSQNQVITVNPNPTVTANTSANPVCNGQTVTLSGGGASTYTWSGGVTNGAAFSPSGTNTYTVSGTSSAGCASTNSAVITVTANPAIITSTAVTNVLCFGNSTGSATVTTSGGAGGYTYLWSGAQTTSVITGQTSGVKTVTVTDANGCTTTNAVSITQPASGITTSTAVTNVLCFGNSTGSATVTTSGGAGGYTYLWSGAQTTSVITGQTAGVRTVTVTDANGCTTTNAVSITQPAGGITTSTAVTNVLCFGNSTGSATVTTSGGAGGYTYLWSGAQTTSVITGQTAGVKTVTVTDANGCSSIKSVSISQPASALATSTAVTNVTCFGNSTGSATVTPTGGTSAYTYLWSTGATTSVVASQTSGVKTVTVTDANGCTSIKSVSISQPAAALATSTAVTNVACFGNSTGSATITATGGTASYTYLWSGAQTTSVITGQTAGVRTVTVTDASGCASINAITISQPAALNVSSTSSSILCNGAVSTITVSAVNGTSPYTGTGTYTVNAGTTSYTVTDNNGCLATTSITVTEPTALNVTSSSSSILCNGGVSSITVSAVDGTSPYTGTGTFTMNAGTNTYTVTDNNGCTATTSITVVEPAALNVSSSSSPILCNGGVSTITVNALDGTAPYTGTGTYTMNAGTNTYTVTDNNGCSATTSITVSEPIVLNVNSSISSSAICLGDIATVTVTAADGTSPYTGTGTFTVNTSSTSYTVTDANGCMATTNASLAVNALPTLVAITNNTLLCSGETATLSVTGAATYTWSTLENTTDIAITPTTQTTYSVNGTDVNGCSNSTTVTQDVSLCTGLSSVVLNDSPIINLFPNPNTGLFTIDLNYTSRVVITNAIGEVIVSETMEVGKHNLDIQNKATGIYFVKVTYDNKQNTLKLIKQ